MDAEFSKYGLISESAEAPGDDSGIDRSASVAAHAAALQRLLDRASALFGRDGFVIEDDYDWQPRWAGGKPRGIENQPPKVYRRRMYARPTHEPSHYIYLG